MNKQSSEFKEIMVAEDNGHISDIIKTILELEGYNVFITSDSKKVVEEAQVKLPSLLLLDIWLGSMDGRKLCKRLKRLQATKHIPIIMLSATNNLARSAKESGADDFLTKPFDIEDLTSKVKENIL